MSPPLVFVADLEHPVLDRDDRHHLERSLRMRAGDEIIIADGRGSWRSARLGPAIDAVGPITFSPRPEPAVTVVFAPVKGERPEWTIAKLTELGVDTIVPMTCRRSVVKWAADHDLTRMRRVAREAAMQSRQPWLPTIGAPVAFNVAAGLPGACLADGDGAPPSLERPVVLIGPEGGWDDTERRAPLAHVRLGPTVLRAETAAVVAAAMLIALRDNVVSVADPTGPSTPA
jgi:16S rRNA (uracil1498-N3)-methyltransferase